LIREKGRKALESFRPAALFYDLDDTLVDRKKAIRGFARQFAQRYGGQDPALNQEMFRALLTYDCEGYAAKETVFTKFFQRFREVLPPMPPMRELIDYWFAEFPRFSLPFPAARPMLEKAAGLGIRQILVTNGYSVLQNRKIDTSGLRDCFYAVLISEEVGAHKPDVRIFRRALEIASLPAGECLFVGDNPVNDITGAHGAGIRGAWVNPGKLCFHFDFEPFAEIDGVGDLLACAQSWQ
jgi:putative hydrolase of the HAD superfamily